MFTNKIKIDRKENKNHILLADRRRSSVLSYQLSNRIFFIITIIEFAALILTSYFIVVKTMSDGLKSVKKDLQTYLTENNNLNKAYQEFLEMNNLYQGIDKINIEKVKMMLPGEMNLPDLLVGLDAIAKNNGFSLKSVSIKILDEQGSSSEKINVKKLEASDEGRLLFEIDKIEDLAKSNEDKSGKILKTVVLEAEITGSGYAGVKKFVSQIENNLRLIDIKSLIFAPEKTSFTIILYTYY